MYNQKLRDALCEYYEEAGVEEEDQALLFGPSGAYDNSIIGFTDDGRAVYDYNRMIDELMEDDGISEEEAQEWIDYNTIRSIPYYGEHAPIVVGLSVEALMDIYGKEGK